MYRVAQMTSVMSHIPTCVLVKLIRAPVPRATYHMHILFIKCRGHKGFKLTSSPALNSLVSNMVDGYQHSAIVHQA